MHPLFATMTSKMPDVAKVRVTSVCLGYTQKDIMVLPSATHCYDLHGLVV